MKKRAQQQGFTLVELLIVVAIIGLLSAIAIPHLINSINRAKQTRSIAEIRNLATAIQMYEIDNGYVLIAATPIDLSVHRGILVPSYIRNLPLIDGWFNPVLYSSDGTSYTVVSHGLDSQPDLPYFPGPIHRFSDDIVFSRGIFVQYPVGGQS